MAAGEYKLGILREIYNKVDKECKIIVFLIYCSTVHIHILGTTLNSRGCRSCMLYALVVYEVKYKSIIFVILIFSLTTQD